MSNPEKKTSNSINISGSSNIIGAIGQGDNTKVRANVSANQGISNNPVDMLIDDLKTHIEALEDHIEQQMAQAAVRGLKEELDKGEAADEHKLEKRFEAIRKTLGDAFQVAIATIANPHAGFALVAQKVATKAREQAENKQD